jgi:hypothetical protein
MEVFVKSMTAKGHWRAGEFWPAEGRSAEVDEATIATLQADPRLEVALAEAAAEPAKEKPKGKKKP